MNAEEYLRRGMDLQRTGQLQRARKLYEQALDAEPTNADAHHLVGLVDHQLGDSAAAAERIATAIDLRPEVATFHCNLAEALRVLGRLVEAETSCRAALQLRPDYVEALHNLGVIFLDQRRFSEAIQAFNDTLRIQPSLALTVVALADALREVGRWGEAVDQYCRALDLRPDLPAAQANLGLLLAQTGRLEEGLAHCRRAVELEPGNPIAQRNLGVLLLEYGLTDEATAVLAAALKLDPNSALLADAIGRSWFEVADFHQAKSWFERAVRLAPENWEARCHLANLHLEGGDPEGAGERFQAMLALNPTCIDALTGLAKALLEQGDVSRSVSLHQEALRLRPDVANLHAVLGNTLSTAGDLDAAVESHRRALELNPRCVPALSGLATTLRGKTSEDTVQQLLELLGAPWMTDLRRSSLHFSLAQVFDGRGDWERAADHMSSANSFQKKHYDERDQAYDPEVHRRFVDHLITAFTPEYFERVRGAGSESVRPIFIVGMPRSGTTLTEQILASHPQVWGAGERRYVNLGFCLLPRVMNVQASPLECLRQLPHPALGRLADGHLAKLNELNPDRAHVVDKMPDNYLLLGWIATLFPQARIIHCTRDPRDVALSCWITNFTRIRWASSLEHLADRIRDYQRIMAHYHRILPRPVFEVNYESMVADQEATTRKLLDFVGLNWHPACLNFHKTERLVRTASVAQVRQPIYQRSVARWQHYERVLRPLLVRLAQHETFSTEHI